MNNATLALNNIYKSYPQAEQSVSVLQKINLTFEQGKAYAITGVSGSGKSTLIYLLAGLETPSEGAVLYNNRPLSSFTSAEKAHFLNSSIGLAFQNPYLIKELTVLENVMIKGMIARCSPELCRKSAQELLDQVGLSDHLNYLPGQLSGGQQQRVALARALMNNPAFLIADETTAHLDEHTGGLIIDMIVALQKEKGMGVILSSHDEYVVSKMATVYELKDGLLSIKK